MTKVNNELLEKAYEWVSENYPERLDQDGFIIGVYNAMKKDAMKKEVEEN